MKCRVPAKSLLAALSLIGCASAPKILPKNEINKPVFHQTDFTALGAAVGPTWTQREGSGTYRDDIYVLPAIIFDNKVSEWASYSILPIFWNLRLTGEQYSDSAHLKTRKLHLAFHGGISDLAYSSRDGFLTRGLLALEGKFLLNRNWFLGALLKSTLHDLEDLDIRIDGLSVAAGAQVSEKNSLKLTYSLNRFHLPRNKAYNYREIYHLDGDTRSEVGLRHTYYAWRKHVLGSDLGFAYRNYSPSKTLQLSAGVHYAYMFD